MEQNLGRWAAPGVRWVGPGWDGPGQGLVGGVWMGWGSVGLDWVRLPVSPQVRVGQILRYWGGVAYALGGRLSWGLPGRPV